jgi:hypothetical protein
VAITRTAIVTKPRNVRATEWRYAGRVVVL